MLRQVAITPFADFAEDDIHLHRAIVPKRLSVQDGRTLTPAPAMGKRRYRSAVARSMACLISNSCLADRLRRLGLAEIASRMIDDKIMTMHVM
jgi:hypothetical protein